MASNAERARDLRSLTTTPSPWVDSPLAQCRPSCWRKGAAADERLEVHRLRRDQPLEEGGGIRGEGAEHPAGAGEGQLLGVRCSVALDTQKRERGVGPRTAENGGGPGREAASVDLDGVVEERTAAELAAQARSVPARPLAVSPENDELAHQDGRARIELEVDFGLEIAPGREEQRLREPGEPGILGELAAQLMTGRRGARQGDRGGIRDHLQRRARTNLDEERCL